CNRGSHASRPPKSDAAMTKLFYILTIAGAILSGVFYFLSSSSSNALKEQIANLENQLSISQNKFSKANSEKNKLSQELHENSTAFNETRSENTVLSARVNQLKRENHRLTEELDDRIETEETLQRDIAKLNNELSTTKASTISLAAIAEYEQKISDLEAENLRLRDTQRRFPGSAASSTPAEELNGAILTVGPGASFVVIDIGYTDGVRLANSLNILRGSRPIAKIEITEVKENLSIGRILPDSMETTPRNGDLVASYN
ncbi:MAG: hypothetical protein AAGB46_08860, partial [Verrucomicrobiota bacterium]